MLYPQIANFMNNLNYISIFSGVPDLKRSHLIYSSLSFISCGRVSRERGAGPPNTFPSIEKTLP
jgi:hypothetical protein